MFNVYIMALVIEEKARSNTLAGVTRAWKAVAQALHTITAPRNSRSPTVASQWRQSVAPQRVHIIIRYPVAYTNSTLSYSICLWVHFWMRIIPLYQWLVHLKPIYWLISVSWLWERKLFNFLTLRHMVENLASLQPPELPVEMICA